MKGSSDEVREQAERKPIGANDGDFEAILLDGCLGFGLSSGNAIVVLLMALCTAESTAEQCGQAVLMAVVAAAALRLGQLFTDGFQTKAGKCVTRYGYLLSSVAAVAALGLGAGYVAVACAGLVLVATSFMYGRFLATLARKALMVIFDVAFMYVGLAFLIFSQLVFWYAFTALAVSVGLSCLVSFLFTRKHYEFNEFVDAVESKRRSIKVKGNNHTLLLLGFMFSGGLIALFIEVPLEVAVVALGASVGLAGILSLLSGQVDERAYKEALKKSCAFVAALFLLPLPVLPPMAQLVVLSAYLCLVSANVIVLFNAVVETSRFNMISPIWLLGQEGSVFCMGVALGCVLFSTGGLLSAQFDLAFYAMCALAVIACAWMQIRVNYQIYPFEPVIESADDDDPTVLELKEHTGQRKTLWQKKRLYACELYALSPREREILQILLKGRDAKYIMDTFYISQSTAKTHIYNIYRKFEVHSRQELMDFIEDIELPPDDAEISEAHA